MQRLALAQSGAEALLMVRGDLPACRLEFSAARRCASPARRPLASRRELAAGEHQVLGRRLPSTRGEPLRGADRCPTAPLGEGRPRRRQMKVAGGGDLAPEPIAAPCTTATVGIGSA
jgi:hypothetical protein